MQQLFETGVRLFNQGEYFAAHEAFEDLWLETTGPARDLYQGLVQVSAGLLKHRRGQDEPALRLLRRGLARLEGLPAEHVDALDRARFIRELRRIETAIEGHAPFDAPAIVLEDPPVEGL